MTGINLIGREFLEVCEAVKIGKILVLFQYERGKSL